MDTVGADAGAAAGDEGGWLTVRAAVCATADVRAACQLAHASLDAPGVPPSRELMEAPIWTTWARYSSGVTQAKVLKYAHEIVARGLQVTHPGPVVLAPAWCEPYPASPACCSGVCSTCILDKLACSVCLNTCPNSQCRFLQVHF